MVRAPGSRSGLALRGAPTSDAYAVVDAQELAEIATAALGRTVTVQIVIAAAFDAQLLLDATDPWSFRVPRLWLVEQRAIAQHGRRLRRAG